MSHFVCVVVVDEAVSADDAIAKAEAMLEPYSEHLEVEAYKNYISDAVEDYYMTDYLKENYPGLIHTDPPTWENVIEALNVQASKDGEHPYGIDETGPYQWSTYNPDSKWDWYSLGGRWSGYFPIKPEGMRVVGRQGVGFDPKTDSLPDLYHSDLSLRMHVDEERSESESSARANTMYDRFEAATAEVTAVEFAEYLPWDHFRDSCEGNYQQAREAYAKQAVVVAMKRDNDLAWYNADYFFVNRGGREAFIADAIKSALTPYACLDSEGWHQKGQMGWFGVSFDDTDDWTEEYYKRWMSIPGDAWVLAYDLHI